MSNLALDVLGAEGTIVLGVVHIDAATVALVQGALGALPAASSDPVFGVFKDKKEIDGRIGPKTRAAVGKFNKQYRGAPEDGESITDGTLAALKLNVVIPPTPAPVITIVEKPKSSSAPPVTQEWTPPSWDSILSQSGQSQIVIKDPAGGYIDANRGESWTPPVKPSLPTAAASGGGMLDGIAPWKLALGALGVLGIGAGVWFAVRR